MALAVSCAHTPLQGPWSQRPADPPLPEPPLAYNPPHYVCSRVLTPLKVDGQLDETAWQQARWTSDFADIEGPSKRAPAHRTRAKMLWDDEYLYVAAEIEEPHLWATLKERDSIIFFDNDIEIFLDPSGSTHNYVEIEINALNTVWDLALTRPYRDNGRALHGWNIAGLQTAVALHGTLNDPSDTDRGWTLEAAIPWKALKEMEPDQIPPNPGSIWRMNFSRVEWDLAVENAAYVKVTDPKTGAPLPEHNWVWSPTGLINIHYPERWGLVYFSPEPPEKSPASFSPDPDEETARLHLRTIYHRQHAYRFKHGHFSESLADLINEASGHEATQPSIQIRATWDHFQARLILPDGRTSWTIDDGGRIWKTGVEP